MTHSVTIMNDASLVDGEGAVHTWLMANSTGHPTQYFSFSNSDTASIIGFDSPGKSSVDEHLKKRLPTEKVSLAITKQQYDMLIKEFTDFYNRNPKYDLTPDNEGDYNCVTASRLMLQIAGIYYLDNIQTPFGVKYKINGGQSDAFVESILQARDDFDASAKDMIRYFHYFVTVGFDSKDIVTRIHFDSEQPRMIPYGSENSKYADYFLNVGGGSSALHNAARFDHLAILRFYIENKGASVSIQNSNGNTPLHFAARYGHLNNVKYLIEKNADFNVLNKVKMTPLHFTTLGGHLKTAEYLVNKYRSQHIDFNVNENFHGVTPLHFAASSGNLELVQFLINNGANVNERDYGGYTPLFYAVSKGGNLPIVMYLLEKGTIVSIQPTNGTPIIHFAALGGHMDIFRYLIDEQHCQFDIRSNDLHTLQYAVRGGSLPVVVYIVDRTGLSVNMVDIYNNTLLHDAATHGYVDIVRYLLKKGANQNARNKGNKTPLDLARNSNVIDCLNAVSSCISQRHRRHIETKQAYPNHFLSSQVSEMPNSNLLIDDSIPATNNGNQLNEINNILVDAWNVPSTALLADLLVRKFTGEKHPLRSSYAETERKAEKLKEAEQSLEKAMQKNFIN